MIMRALQADMQGGEVFDVDSYGHWLEKSFVPVMNEILRDADHPQHQKMNILSLKILQETVNLAVFNQGTLSFTHRAIYDVCKRLGHVNKDDAEKIGFVAECSLTTAKLIPLAMQGCGVSKLISTEAFGRQSKLTEQLWALEDDPQSVDLYPQERLYDERSDEAQCDFGLERSQPGFVARGVASFKKLFR